MVTDTKRVGKGSKSLPGRPDLPRFPKPCAWCGEVFNGLLDQRYDTAKCKQRAAYDRVKRRAATRKTVAA